MGKKIYKIISGLPFGIVLLVLIAIYSVFGTLFPQGMHGDFYISRYPGYGGIIILFGFHNAFKSIIFRLLMLLFMINLTTCTYNFLPSKIKRVSSETKISLENNDSNLWMEDFKLEEVKGFLKKRGFKEIDQGDGIVFEKFKWGHLGSTVTHIGILVILIGYMLGNLTAQEGYFNMMPGEEIFFPSKEFRLRLNNFEMAMREDGSIDQYYSYFTILKDGREPKDRTIWVNNPMKYEGISFYQSNYGWAGQLKIIDNDEASLMERYMKSGDQQFFQPMHLTFYLYGFYPNFRIGHDGQPATMGQALLNPRFAVIVYQFGQHIDSVVLRPGEVMEFDEYKVTFDLPVLYTGITYRRDLGYPIALLGFLLLTLGIIIAFYFYPRHVVYKREGILYGVANKNTWGFNYWLKTALKRNLENKGE